MGSMFDIYYFLAPGNGMFNANIMYTYKMDKQKLLDAFVAKWSNLPEQRSPEWFAARTHSIGASEMSTLMGLNHYQDIRRLIEMHCKLVEFGDKTAVNWGNVMEQVITNMTEIIFQCKITEMGSIPTAGARGQRCSPDGVSIVEMLGNLIVSFEFKAPKNRLPRGRVPEYYIPQVYSCLCAVEPADIGIFVDVVIRRCSIQNWTFGNTEYDKKYHRSSHFNNVVAKAILYFCDDEKHDEPHGPANLGECDPKELDARLSDVAEHHKYRVHYGPVYMGAGPDILFENAIESEMPENCIAYLPIKIMRVDIIPVNKIPGYVKRYQKIIDKVLRSIKIIMDSPEEERMGVCNIECYKNGW